MARGITRRAALALGATASLAGCAPREPDGMLSVWGLGLQGEALQSLLPPFARATGLAVAAQALPMTEAHEKVLTAFAGGVLPDVLMVSNDWLPELIALRAVQPLPGGDALAGQGTAGVRSVTATGRVWALPSTISTQAQFYRPDLLAAAGYPSPPPRRAEWLAMLRAVKRRAPDRFALLMLLDWPEHLLTFAAQNGATPLRDQMSRGNFSSPAFRDALAVYKGCFDEGLAPRVILADIGDTVTAFGRGLVAVMPSGSFTISDFAKRPDEVPRSLWAATALPGPDGPAAAPTGGTSFAVTAHARDPGQAWALARYLCTAPVQLSFCALTGELPTRGAAWAAPAIVREPAFGVFADQLGRPALPPAVPEWAHVQTEMQLVAERVARGELGVDAAAAEMDARADTLLAKRRWLLDRGTIA